MTEKNIRRIADVIRDINPTMIVEEIKQTWDGDYLVTAYRGNKYLIDRTNFRVKWIGKHQFGD